MPMNDYVSDDFLNTFADGALNEGITTIDGKTIKVDDIMGIDDNGIQEVGNDVEVVTLGLLRSMVDKESELICIYYGNETPEEKAVQLSKKAEELYPDCEVQMEYGGQPIYYFLLSVE